MGDFLQQMVRDEADVHLSARETAGHGYKRNKV